MPIQTTHPEYDIEGASITTDAFKGSVQQEKYVPRLTKQTTAKYKQYVERGNYYNVTSRTASAVVGTILRKPPTMDEDGFEVVDDMTERELVTDLLVDLLLQGKSGLMVDFSEEAYLIPVDGVNIVNWRDDGSLIVLKESVYVEDKDDHYKLIPVTQYRELILLDGIYTIRIWKSTGRDAYEISEEYVPTNRGVPLDFIPFQFITPFDNSTDTHKPVLQDLAELNISHFRTSVDQEHILHFSALPQPYISGDFQVFGDADQPSEISIGTDVVWQITPESKVGFLEFSGIAIDSVGDALAHKEDQMLTIGIRLLSDKKGVESADSLKIRANTENATLLSMVLAVESAIKHSLEIMDAWNGGNGEDQMFEMSKDFAATALSSEDIKTQLELLNSNNISEETFLENLYAGEIIPGVEEEQERLANSNSTEV